MTTETPNLEQRARFVRVVYCTIIAAAAGLLLIPMFVKHHRIGDGSEYYVMYLAWKLTHRPFITPGLREAYEALTTYGYVDTIWPFDQLFASFPRLRLGDQQDFNHFWFYSLLAAVVGTVLPAKIAADPTHAFYALHWVLIFAAAGLAYYLFRWPGVAAVMITFAASPALWYLNKIHTEFFTIALSVIAVLAILDRRFIWATLAFAVAGTQNPSFAILAAVAGLIWMLDPRQRASRIDTIVAVISGVIVILHPLYYWSRFGGLSPQAIGGAALNSDIYSFLRMPIWLVDPDLGLLPYWWPLGLLLAVCAVFTYRSFDFRGGWLAIGMLGIYLLFNSFAATQQFNLNSGGTVGISRYSTWFICCFVPFLIIFMRDLFRCPSPLMWGAYVLGFGLAIDAIVKFRPGAPEDFLHPTPLSTFVQTYLPRLYRPPTEIFIERYSGYDEVVLKAAAVVGPDCGRVAFLASRLHAGTVEARYCPAAIDPEKLLAFMQGRLYGRDPRQWQYTRLSGADLDTVRLRPSTDYSAASTPSLQSVLKTGWSFPESWGVWSAEKTAIVALPVSRAGFPSGARIAFHTGAYIPKDDVVQVVKVFVGGKILAEWRYYVQSKEQLRELVLRAEDLPASDPILIQFNIPTAVAPSKFGSTDKRELGMAIGKISISNL